LATTITPKSPARRNARADADVVARSLGELGLKVELRTELDERRMRGAVRSFIAGHGVQLGAANYLLPIDI
jgi:hypothetical protein